MNEDDHYCEKIARRIFDQRLNITYDLSQDIIHSQVPPLQNVVLIKMISEFWQSPEIRKEIKSFVISYPDTLNEHCKGVFWIPVEEKVRSNLTFLQSKKAYSDLGYRICHAIGCNIYEFVTDSHFEKVPKDLFAENYSITWQGTINKTKTLWLILQKLTLPSLKYEFSCYYFIESQARFHFDKLPDHLKFYYLNELECSLTNFTLAFWNWRINKSEQLFYDIVHLYRFDVITCETTSIRDCVIALFEWQVTCNNEVAVQYMWKYLLDEEEKENSLLPRAFQIIHSDKHRNMMCFFIGQMNLDQQIKLLKDNSYRILIRFLDWRWESVFVEVAKFTFKFLTNWDFAEILHALVYYVCNQHKYFPKDSSCRKVLLDFLLSSPFQSREFIIKVFPNKYYDMMVNLFKTNDHKIIEVFTTFSKPTEYMYSPESISLCEQFIEETDWESIDLYIKSILKSQDLISDFKKKILEEKGLELCVRFIILERWKAVEGFLEWCLFDDKQIKELKGYLPFIFAGEIINAIFRNLHKDFSRKIKTIDRILNWCFHNNISLIRACKKQILLNEPKFYDDISFKRKWGFYSEAKNLIIRKQWEIVKKCLNFCFADEDDIRMFCDKLLLDYGYILRIIKHDLSLELLNYFINCCNADTYVIGCIKVSILERHSFFVSLITKLMLQEADRILNWCLEEEEKQLIFKQDLLALSIRILLKYISKEETFCRLLQWFNPTSKSIATLRRELCNWYQPGNKNLNPKIDNLLEHLRIIYYKL